MHQRPASVRDLRKHLCVECSCETVVKPPYIRLELFPLKTNKILNMKNGKMYIHKGLYSGNIINIGASWPFGDTKTIQDHCNLCKPPDILVIA